MGEEGLQSLVLHHGARKLSVAYAQFAANVAGRRAE